MWPIRLQILSLTTLILQTQSMGINTFNYKRRQDEMEQMKQSTQLDYLNRKRPLWVLDDEVAHSGELDMASLRITTTTERPWLPGYYYQKYRRNKMLPQVGFYRKKSPEKLYLPRNYLHSGGVKKFNDYDYEYGHLKRRMQRLKTWRRQQQQRQQSIPISTKHENFMPSMPIFDSVPIDIDSSDSKDVGSSAEMLTPIFIYSGPKGELIMNTMLSARKYPMQEPVPGEILYPPTAPIFRPKPFVQSFRMPGRNEPLNLTLIPFYAHEAIVPRLMFDSYSKSNIDANSSKTTAAEMTTATHATAKLSTPAVIYAAEADEAASNKPTSSATKAFKSKKKRRHKKSKKYAVYRSADEVHWRPTVPSATSSSSALSSTASTLVSAALATTSIPMVLPSPLQNHRFNLIDDGYYGYDDIIAASATTPLTTSTTSRTTTTTTALPSTSNPMKNFKLTYKDEDSHFQIVYVDESLERPTTQQILPTKPSMPFARLHRVSTPKPLPLLSSHYARDKEYYAFPVYTLGKLLKPDNEESHWVHAHKKQKLKAAQNSADTLFIVNSRYKGQNAISGPKKLSSKYIETRPIYEAQHSDEDFAETTIEKATIA